MPNYFYFIHTKLSRIKSNANSSRLNDFRFIHFKRVGIVFKAHAASLIEDKKLLNKIDSPLVAFECHP